MYVVSTSGNSIWALEEGNVIAITHSGPDPFGDAQSYARDHTKATDQIAYIYEVDTKPKGHMKINKEVVFAPQ